MKNFNLPVWSGYLIAPVLILAFSLQVILKSENRFILVVFAIGCGLMCAGVLHGYLTIKKKLFHK